MPALASLAQTLLKIGSPGVPGKENQGNTSNAGFVVTGDGVVVFDALGTPSLGWALLAAYPLAIALAACLVPFFWLKSSVEERWLQERFSSYADYRRRTRRFIARIG